MNAPGDHRIKCFECQIPYEPEFITIVGIEHHRYYLCGDCLKNVLTKHINEILVKRFHKGMSGSSNEHGTEETRDKFLIPCKRCYTNCTLTDDFNTDYICDSCIDHYPGGKDNDAFDSY